MLYYSVGERAMCEARCIDSGHHHLHHPEFCWRGSGSVWRVLDGPRLAPRRPRADLLLRCLCALTDRTLAPQPTPLMAQVQFIMFSLLHLWVLGEKCQLHQFTPASPKTEAPGVEHTRPFVMMDVSLNSRAFAQAGPNNTESPAAVSI